MNMKILAAFLALIIIGASGVVAVWYLLAPKPNPYDFAVVFATGGLGDKSFNDGAYKGANDIRTEYGLDFAYSTPTAISQYEPMLRAFAAHSEWIEPYKIIVAIGFDQATALQNVAHDYPGQNFAIVDMYIDPGTYPKVASLLFNEHEGSALVGALAGLYTTKNKLGFVGGMSIPLIHKFGAGYFWGANLTNPALAVKNLTQSASCVKGYVGDWSNIPAGKALADIMYQTNGTDIIYAAAGRSGLGVIESAAELNGTGSIGTIYAIGVDSPQMYLGCADPEHPTAPTVVLTSMLKRVDVAVHDIVKAACVTATFAGGVYTFNLANSGVGWENNPALKVIPAAYVAKLNMIAQGIINGTYTVPQTFPWLL